MYVQFDMLTLNCTLFFDFLKYELKKLLLCLLFDFSEGKALAISLCHSYSLWLMVQF